MKILILEDNIEKSEEIEALIKSIDASITIVKVECYNNFILKIQKEKFDLVIIDLYIPAIKGRQPDDMSEELLFSLRNEECTNVQTEVVAITKYDEKASDIIQDYNYQNITVLTFSEDNKWKESLIKKIVPLNSDNCDFIIVCALEKEANAFHQAGFNVSESVSKYSLNYRSISVLGFKGAIIRLPKPGLVDAAIVTSRAIEIFNPKIVTMSGICAGLKSEINIYDLIVPNLCFQHDTGKWTEDGLISEPYSVPINNKVEIEISTELEKPHFTADLMENIKAGKSEIPEEDIVIKTHLGVTASGSTVIADKIMNATIQGQHRKVIGLDMEIFSVYESCRLAQNESIRFFSIKSVVDNGSPTKGDAYHRIACLVSAKATMKIIEKLLLLN